MTVAADTWGRPLGDVDDSALLSRVREGDAEAYAELWRRHLPAAYAVAHRYRARASVEDVVGEASLRVFGLIQAGKGPTTHFRSYFLTTVRTVATDMVRHDLRVVPVEETALEPMTTPVDALDPSRAVDHELVRTAFRRLPERDQELLWQTTVEGQSPAVVATAVGASANWVSVTAMRARDTLRAQYLDAHADSAIARAEDAECAWVLARMGKFVRGKLPARQRARVAEHIQVCGHAQGLAAELAEVNRALPAVTVPLVFGAAMSSGAGWATVAGLGGSTGGGNSRGEGSTTLAVSGLVGLGSKAAGLALVATLGAGGLGLVPQLTSLRGLSSSSAADASVAGGPGAGSSGAGSAAATTAAARATPSPTAPSDAPTAGASTADTSTAGVPVAGAATGAAGAGSTGGGSAAAGGRSAPVATKPTAAKSTTSRATSTATPPSTRPTTPPSTPATTTTSSATAPVVIAPPAPTTGGNGAGPTGTGPANGGNPGTTAPTTGTPTAPTPVLEGVLKPVNLTTSVLLVTSAGSIGTVTATAMPTKGTLTASKDTGWLVEPVTGKNGATGFSATYDAKTATDPLPKLTITKSKGAETEILNVTVTNSAGATIWALAALSVQGGLGLHMGQAIPREVDEVGGDIRLLELA